MKRLFVGNLPPTTSEASLEALFSEFGKVRGMKLTIDLFTGKCKGFGFIEMEGHEARAAIAALNGKSFEGNIIKVNFEKEHRGRSRR